MKSASEGQLRHSEQFVTVHNRISYTRKMAAVTKKIPEFNDKKKVYLVVYGCRRRTRMLMSSVSNQTLP